MSNPYPIPGAPGWPFLKYATPLPPGPISQTNNEEKKLLRATPGPTLKHAGDRAQE